MVLVVEGIGYSCAGEIGVILASAACAGFGGVISGMAACGVCVVSGAGLPEQGVGKADPAERAEHDIGHGGEPEAELVGAHGGGRGAVGEQVELAFLDPVLHLAAGAADRLAEIWARNFARLERGDDEAGIGLALGSFGLADHPPGTVPALQRLPDEVTEPAGRLSGGGALRLGGREFGPDPGDQARVAGEAEDVINPVGFAPVHQRVAAEAGIGTQQDPHPRPAPAELANGPFSISSTAPAAASRFDRRSFAASRCRPG